MLLLASITLLSAALQNWPFNNSSSYVFDSTKIEVSGGLAKLKPYPPATVHDEFSDFSGTHSNTEWVTDRIQLNSTGLSSGSGIYTSQAIDSGVDGMQWSRMAWTEALTQGSANFSVTNGLGTLSVGLSVYGADIDGDDDIDVVVTQEGTPRVLYFENNGTETFTPRTVSNGQPVNPADIHVADINKDGRADLVVLGNKRLEWYENMGGARTLWTRWILDSSLSTGFEVEVADINSDGNLDIAVTDSSSVRWYQNNVNELQDKVERLNVLMNVNREIAEKLLERSPLKEPVIKTWFETGA